MTPQTRETASRMLWPTIAALMLLWNVARSWWAIEDRFVSRREFEHLSGRVDAIARHLGVPE